MSLKNKARLFIIAASLIMIILFIYVYASISRGIYDRLEEESARQGIRATVSALNSAISDLSDLGAKYAAREEVRTALQKKRGIVSLRNIFAETALAQSELNIVVVSGPEKVIYATGYDDKDKGRSALPQLLLSGLKPDDTLLHHPSLKSLHRGLMTLQEKTYLLASLPFADTANPEKVAGTIILGRLLDISADKHFSQLGSTKPAISDLNDKKLSADKKNIRERLTSTNQIHIDLLPENKITGYTLVNDIKGQPAFLLESTLPRLYSDGSNTLLRYVSIAIAITIAALALLFYLFLNKFVFSSLNNISRQVKAITAGSSPDNRITARSKDAAGGLGEAINSLIAKMELTQKEIGDTDRFNRRITDNMLDFVIQIDLKGTYQYVSPSHKNVLGHPAEKLIGKSVFDIIYERDLKKVLKLLQQHILTGSPIRFECRAHHSAGRFIWLDAFANPLYDDSHKLIGAVIVGRDITIYKKAMEELQKIHTSLEDRITERTKELVAANNVLIEEIMQRENIEKLVQKSRNMLRAVFDGLSDPLVMVDNQSVVLMLNEAALHYFGYSTYQEMIGKSCSEAFGKINYNADETERIRLAITKKETTSLELSRLAQFWIYEKIFIYPVALKNIADGEAIIRITDLTKAKLVERQLVQGEKLASLGLLISGIAHEINNPNNFIIFNIPILTDYLKEVMPIIDDFAAENPDYELFGMTYQEFREDIFKLLKNIQHGSERINSTVSKLREFSRKKEDSDKRWVNPNEVVEKAISICQIQINKTVKHFTLEMEENLPDLHTDANGLEQVLINLLINATQAMDKYDSVLTIRAHKTNNWHERVIITIEDNGCGMDEITKANIFNPFFTTKPYGMGTGLGLYISKNIIESLGGRIEIASAFGEGTTARIILAEIEEAPSGKT